MSDDARMTDLELRYMVQSELLEQLNGELIESNARVGELTKRVSRLEAAVEELLRVIDPPPNEPPPHY